MACDGWFVASNSKRACDQALGEGDVASGRTPGDLLLHPVALLALVLVIFNDRVLKVRYPSEFTGKLSDVAGLVFGQQVSSNGLTPARVLEEVGKLVGQGPAQLGGHATVGRGLCRVVMEA